MDLRFFFMKKSVRPIPGQGQRIAAVSFSSNHRRVTTQTSIKTPIRVAAIAFLNPAPLMWDFEHPPRAAELARRYSLSYMLPSECAASLLDGTADLGLVPIAALTPELAIVPGPAIAALDRVRSIQLIVKGGRALGEVRSVAADTASRSSLAYVHILFKKFLGGSPEFIPAVADPIAMLESADAALLIGDPALLALEAREAIERQAGPCQWFDIAHEWRLRTGLPWVAAVWAARADAIADPTQLVADLGLSRANGLAHIEDLVAEWTPRLAIPPATIRAYLTQNIHYALDPACLEALHLFRRYAYEIGLLPPLPGPRFL
jgi:chorismate dehydratase